MNFTDQIKNHALEDAPNEACGLVFGASGVFTAVPYPNSHLPEKERTAAFRIDEKSVLAALKSKMLIGIYHSHTDDMEDFSDTDKAISEEFQIPSYLYLVKSDKFKVFNPSGNRPPLIGRPYIPFVYDCITAVRDWYREKLGIESNEPEYTQEECVTGKITGIPEYFLSHGCKPVSKVRENDVVCMMIRCHAAPNHMGVILPDGTMFHHMYNRVSQVVPYGGIWQRCTSLIFRHPKFL